MKQKIIGKMQTFGDAMTAFIPVIPIAGIMLGVGNLLGSNTIAESAPFLQAAWIQMLAVILREVGSFIMNNLPILFALSITGKLCEGDFMASAGTILMYLVQQKSISCILNLTQESVEENAALYTTVFGIPTLSTGVFGGIFCGLVVTWLYWKFKEIRFPEMLSLFSGKNFVVIISILSGIILAFPITIIWPFIQVVIDSMTGFIIETQSPFMPFIYLLAIRYLAPVGLSALIFVPINYQLGTYITVSGEMVHGVVPMFIAQLADGVTPTYAMYLNGLYFVPAFIGGIAMAIVHTAEKKNQKKLIGVYSAGIFNAVLTGSTEAVEYTFMYKNMILYYIHTTFLASGALLTYVFQIYVGTAYSGGIIDYIIYGVLQGARNCWMVIPLNVIVGVLYYGFMKFLIVRFHIRTPGRENMIV